MPLTAPAYCRLEGRVLPDAGVLPSRARQLIFAYAGVLVLLNLSVLLPGNPDYGSGWNGAAASLAIQGLIVWRLWHR
jgi:hypothetical protein